MPFKKSNCFRALSCTFCAHYKTQIYMYPCVNCICYDKFSCINPNLIKISCK